MIGNRSFVLIFLCSLFSTIFPAAIQLRLLDERGISCDSVARDERCRLEIKITGVDNQINWPLIPGIDQSSILGRQQRSEVSWVNGKQNSAYYLLLDLRFSVLGRNTIGPVRYMIDGKNIISNTVSYTVVDGPQKIPAVSQSQQQNYFLRWELEKDRIYVGELVPVSLCLYTTDASTQIERVSEIAAEGMGLLLEQTPHQKSVLHNGTRYAVVEWRGTICPEKTGLLQLPAVTMDVAVQAKNKSASPWNFMHNFFEPSMVQQRLQAPSHAVSVKALSATQHSAAERHAAEWHVAGVGVIRSVEWHIDRDQVMSGDAVVVSRTIIGSCSPARVSQESPQVHGIPVKTYYSGVKTEGTYPAYTIHQEWVVQVCGSGKGIVAAQDLWFFNPEREVYELFKLPELSFLAIENPQKNVQDRENQDSAEKASEDSKSYVPQERAVENRPTLPLWIFLLLTGIPVGICSIRKRLHVWLAHVYRIVYIEYRTRKALYYVGRVSVHDGYRLVELFQQFIFHVVCRPSQESIRGLVKSFLIDHNAAALVEEWLLFWSELESVAFSDKKRADVASMKEKTSWWIATLGQFVRKEKV